MRAALRASLAVLVAAPIAAAPPAKARPSAAALVVAQVPATPGASPSAGEGGRLVLVPPRGKGRVLTAAFHSAADPEVSFDGRSILFAAKEDAGAPWCVYEMKADGTGARKITCGAAGARQPVYQSTIYTITPTTVEPWIQVAFVGENPGEVNEAGSGPNTSLWSCKRDGTMLRRLTYNLSNDRDPAILPDGRMVYAGWLRSPGPELRDRVALVGVNQDGTDYQVYAGDQGLRAKRMPAPTTSGLVVFVESDRVDGGDEGLLASVTQVRPLHSYRSLSAESDGLFRSPAPLPDGRLLVAWRPADGRAPFSIERLDPATGVRERAFAEAGWHSVQAKLVAPRPVPDARSSVVRDDDPDGKLYTIDVSIQERGKELPPGSVKGLRIVEGVAATAGRPVVRRVLGELPLAEDGSYQVQIPANTPVQVELLDARGAALRTSAWLWVRNHAAQGCVGCHEDPERTPPNRFVKALSAPAPVLNRSPDRRPVVGEGSTPSASEVRAFVSSIDPGGQR